MTRDAPPSKRARWPRRALLVGGAAALVVAPIAWVSLSGRKFPPDTTPEGAYLRIVLAVTRGKLGDAFAYLETRAQWAVHSQLDCERRAHELVSSSYPEPERAVTLLRYKRAEEAKDAPDYFSRVARERGYEQRLRNDLSGIKAIERADDRATVETARGTRYPFRRRENGIWGITLFTADLVVQAEQAARDLGIVEAAAADYRGR